MLPTIRLCQKEEEDASWDVERQVWDPFNWQADGSVGIDYDPNLHFVALEGSKVIATIDGQPMDWDGDSDSLPLGGWTALVLRARDGFSEQPNWAFAVGASILPEFQSAGVAGPLLIALRDQALSLGYFGLVAPVRPTKRATMPQLDISQYRDVRLSDGRHVDPWVRIHEKVGGRIIGCCEDSAVFGGTREQWEEWSKRRLPDDGDILIPGAQGWLEMISGYGVLREDSLWVLHDGSDPVAEAIATLSESAEQIVAEQ